jgi:O-antigen/teichoic acid export membrane protein
VGTGQGYLMLSKKTVLGAGWLVSSRLGGRIVDFVTVLILARTLTPADFGLTALAMSLIAVADIVFELPVIGALTRLKQVEKSHLDTAFTLSTLRGLVFSIVILGAAWPYSIVFRDHRLAPLVTVLAIGPISRGLCSPNMVQFIRQMSFHQAFVAELAGKILAAVTAVGAVYLGAGYWAIAASSITASAATTLISYLIAPYRPAFSLAKLADFSRFMGWFNSAQVISAVSWQFDRALLGYFVTKSQLGQYTMATDLSTLPSQSLLSPAMQPVLAAFASINDDPERLQKAFLKAAHFTMLIGAPACIGMALTSDLIVDVLLGGSKWQAAAVYMQWLPLATMLALYNHPLSCLALATDRPRALFRLNLVEFCLRTVLISLGLYFYAVEGVIAARLVLSFATLFVMLWIAQELGGGSIALQIRSLWSIALSSAAMAVLVLLVRRGLSVTHIRPLFELAFAAGLGGAAYVGTLFALGIRLRIRDGRMIEQVG